MPQIFNYGTNQYESVSSEEWEKRWCEKEAMITEEENEKIRRMPCIKTIANELKNAQEVNKALREEVARLRQALLETLDLLQSLSVAAAAVGKN